MQRVRVPLEGIQVDGELLKSLRTERGITQKTLAERSQISEHWLRRIEIHGQQPSKPVVESIAEGLGCTISDFCVVDAERRPRRRRTRAAA